MLSGFSKAMLGVYALTLFVSATLLFLVQLVVGKMITPLLGGTPEVWNTCMVFFQALLLVGYLYAHISTTWLGPRTQSMVHLGVLLIPLLFFPLAVNKNLIQGGETHPIPTVLLVLALSVGVPFFVVSTSAPLLQKWFSSTNHPSARDPYFLYGASNLGSMLALLTYPVLTEPMLTLSQQRLVWMIGYGVLIAMTCLCVYFLKRSPDAEDEIESPTTEEQAQENITVKGQTTTSKKKKGGKKSSDITEKSSNITEQPSASGPGETPELSGSLSGEVTFLRRLRWVLLAAVPSSLMLGVTKYITTDIAPMPMLWVLPLALYLGTFIIVFSQSLEKVLDYAHKGLILAMPLAILLLLFVMLADMQPSGIGYRILVHLGVFFIVTLVLHGELARDRPSTEHLTEFYVWMSFGGVMGGLFNGLLSPVVFHALIEYPLALMVACLLLPALTEGEEETSWGVTADVFLVILFVLAGFLLIAFRIHDGDLNYQAASRARWGWHLFAIGAFLVAWGIYSLRGKQETRPARVMDFALPLTLCLLVIGLIWGLYSDLIFYRIRNLAATLNVSELKLRMVMTYGLPAVLCYTFIERSVRFGLGVGAILMAAAIAGTGGLFDPDYIYQERGFFGVLQVEKEKFAYEDSDGDEIVHVYHRLVHGTTLHGQQYNHSTINGEEIVFRGMRREPLTYYHRTGPVGQMMDAYNAQPAAIGLLAGPIAGVTAWEATNPPLGVIGLGTGTMACYAHPGQRLTFYDIDPLVKEISFDKDEYFTYVQDALKRGADVDLQLNDARLAIERQVAEMEQSSASDAEKEAQRFGVLIVDAFSSDAIPVHLITQEALRLYLQIVREEGIIAFHISNRYLDLQPVLANLAEQEGLVGLYEHDYEEGFLGKTSSTWVVLARKDYYLERFLTYERWEPTRKHLQELLLPLCAMPNIGVGADVSTQSAIAYLALSAQYEKRGETYHALRAPWYPLDPDPKVGIWTDDYCNLFSVLDLK